MDAATFPVDYGATKEFNRTHGVFRFRGMATITPDGIRIEGRDQRQGGSGGAGLTGVAVDQTVGRKLRAFTPEDVRIDPRSCKAFCDPRPRVFALELPDDKWLALRVMVPDEKFIKVSTEEEYEALHAALSAVLAEPIEPENLHRMEAWRARLLTGLIGVAVLLMLIAAVVLLGGR